MENKIKVAIADFAPLIIDEDGVYKGFEIDLWEAIAKEINVDFEYTKYKFKEIIPLLVESKVDVGLAGITITERREKSIDFSHSTLDSGLLISVNKDKNKPRIFKTIKTVFTEGGQMIKSAVIGLFVFILISGNLLWVIEKNAGTFNKSYFPGIFESFWLTVVSMTTVGFGDYIPHTWLGKVITVGIIFSGAIIFGLLVAQVTAFLAIKTVKGEINNSRDLIGKTVVTVEGSTSENILRKIGAKINKVSSAGEAYQQLREAVVDAVVFDAPVALYYAKNDKTKQIEIVGELFDKQKYGIALRHESTLRENINRAILKLVESGQYDVLYKKWFGEDLTMEV